jgi:hypothetical protein
LVSEENDKKNKKNKRKEIREKRKTLHPAYAPVEILPLRLNSSETLSVGSSSLD